MEIQDVFCGFLSSGQIRECLSLEDAIILGLYHCGCRVYNRLAGTVQKIGKSIAGCGINPPANWWWLRLAWGRWGSGEK